MSIAYMLNHKKAIASFAIFAVVMCLTCKNCHATSSSSNATNETEDIPNEFQCPISHMLMIRPVITEHNKSYDEWAIERWIRHQNKSNIKPYDPQTRAIFQTFQLTVNITKLLSIHSWIAQSYVVNFCFIFVVNS